VGEFFEQVVDLLLEKRRYRDVVEVGGDFTARVREMIDAVNKVAKDSKLGKDTMRAIKDDLLKEAGRYYEALVATDETKQADALRDQLLAFDGGVTAYTTLIRHAQRATKDKVVQALLSSAKSTLSTEEFKRVEEAKCFVAGVLPPSANGEVGNLTPSYVIARTIGSPEPRLMQILSALVKSDILHGNKGPNGGYRMARPLVDISLLEVIEAVDGREQVAEQFRAVVADADVTRPAVTSASIADQVSLKGIFANRIRGSGAMGSKNHSGGSAAQVIG
jgi:hypothetical protein